MGILKEKLLSFVSKKLSVSLIGILTIMLNQKLKLGIDSVHIAGLASMIVTYVSMQGIIDNKKVGK